MENKNIFLFLVILIIILIFNFIINEKVEGYSNNPTELFDNMMSNHYKLIFPNNANRNAAGFRFFKYIYDNLATNEQIFDLYNTFYCGVSGSIVSPSSEENYSILKVKNRQGNCVFGKYYRCCVPCNCDIMKYAIVINTKIEMPKGSGKFIQRNLLTIGDPCVKISNENPLPNEVDKNVFKCNNNMLEGAYRVDENNNLTNNNGRLVIGVLYPVIEDEKEKVSNALNICTTGNKRLFSSPENLKYGMGDIFVKLALINDNTMYKNNLDDLCK